MILIGLYFAITSMSCSLKSRIQSSAPLPQGTQMGAFSTAAHQPDPFPAAASAPQTQQGGLQQWAPMQMGTQQYAQPAVAVGIPIAEGRVV